VSHSVERWHAVHKSFILLAIQSLLWNRFYHKNDVVDLTHLENRPNHIIVYTRTYKSVQSLCQQKRIVHSIVVGTRLTMAI